MSLLIDLAKDTNNNIIKYDITDMPHCLISGIGPSGKTVVLDSIIVSLIQNYTKDDVRIMISDFNNCEFNVYNNIPHLLCPLITNNEDLIEKLDYLNDVMNERYILLRDSDCYNIRNYNDKYSNDKNNTKLPYIVMCIDDISYALIGEEEAEIINQKLMYLLVKGRTVGIHLILSIHSRVLYRISCGNLSNLRFRIVLPCNNSLHYSQLLEEKINDLRLSLGEMVIKDCTGEIIKAKSIYYNRMAIKDICDNL